MWHFDEPAGASTAADSSGNSLTGALRGGVVAGLAGFEGTAFGFDRPGSWVEVNADDRLNPGPNDFSYSAYVNLTEAPTTKKTTYDIIRKGLAHTAGGEYKLEVVKGGRVRCTAKDDSGTRVGITGPSASVGDGAWHHVACGRTGSTWWVRVDDTTRSKLVTLGSVHNSRSLSIGSKYGKEDSTPGRVDEPRVIVEFADAP